MYSLSAHQAQYIDGTHTLKLGQYYKVYSWMADLGLPTAQMLAYAVLYSYSKHGSKETFCSYQHLSELTMISKSALRRCVHCLVDKKLVERINPGKPFLRLSVIPQESLENSEKSDYIRIESWMPALLPFHNYTELLVWALIDSLSKRIDTVVISRAEICEKTLLSPSSVTRIFGSLADKGLLDHKAAAKFGGGKVVLASTQIPYELRGLIQEIRGRKAKSERLNNESPSGGEDETSSCIEKGQLQSEQTCTLDLEVSNARKDDFRSYVCNQKDISNHIENKHQSIPKTDLSANTPSLTEKEAHIWEQLKNLNMKPSSKNEQEAYWAFVEVIRKGYEPSEILSAYAKYKHDYLSNNDTLQYAKKLDRWLTEAGGMRAYLDPVSSRTIPKKETKAPLSLLVALFAHKDMRLSEWAEEFTDEGVSDKRKKELALMIRTRCAELEQLGNQNRR